MHLYTIQNTSYTPRSHYNSFYFCFCLKNIYLCFLCTTVAHNYGSNTQNCGLSFCCTFHNAFYLVFPTLAFPARQSPLLAFDVAHFNQFLYCWHPFSFAGRKSKQMKGNIICVMQWETNNTFVHCTLHKKLTLKIYAYTVISLTSMTF